MFHCLRLSALVLALRLLELTVPALQDKNVPHQRFISKPCSMANIADFNNASVQSLCLGQQTTNVVNKIVKPAIIFNCVRSPTLLT